MIVGSCSPRQKSSHEYRGSSKRSTDILQSSLQWKFNESPHISDIRGKQSIQKKILDQQNEKKLAASVIRQILRHFSILDLLYRT